MQSFLVIISQDYVWTIELESIVSSHFKICQTITSSQMAYLFY